jgi:hypothetical protein
VASNEAIPFPGASAEPAYRFLSPHQAAVLDAAAHRLDPDPHNDAHALRLTVFVDCLLSVFRVAPGGPLAAGSLRQRVTDLRSEYCSGIALLDELAGGDFTAVPPLQQHLILAQGQLAAFAGLVFGHIIEAIGRNEPADVRSR